MRLAIDEERHDDGDDQAHDHRDDDAHVERHVVRARSSCRGHKRQRDMVQHEAKDLLKTRNVAINSNKSNNSLFLD